MATKLSRKTRAIPCLLLLAGTASAWAAGASSGAAARRRSLIAELQSRHYFLNASCTEFASYVLSRAGLPALDQAGPVDGERGNVDRADEDKTPPGFSDELISRTVPRHRTWISAKGGSRMWRLTLERDVERSPSKLRLRTSYLFGLDQRNNKSSCEFLEIDFSPQPNGRLTRMSTDGCLELLLDGLPVGADPRLWPAIDLLRTDCSVGLHYSYAAKKSPR